MIAQDVVHINTQSIKVEPIVEQAEEPVVEDSTMRVEVKWYEDPWQEIKDAAMFTIHKNTGKYPTSAWKKKILMAEHSPIRLGRFIIRCYNVPSFVIGHLVRHVTMIPFVSSLRSDRADYSVVPDRNTPNNFQFEANFQTLINISRRRLCTSASKETRELWQMIREAIKEYEPELAECMIPECVYRGHCTEMYSCNWYKTDTYKEAVARYHDGINDGK